MIMKTSQRHRFPFANLRRARLFSRAGETDSKTVIIIVLAVVGGGLLLVCLGLAAFLIPAVQSAREAARRTQSKNNLAQIGLALHNYHDLYKTFPPGGVYAADGTPHHSWQTMLLPYVDNVSLFSQIDFNVPWTDPRNEGYFRTVVFTYLNPSEPMQTTPEGFAVSHIAGNQHVFFENSRWRIADTIDGTSNTVFAGEVAAGFKAWGDPTNIRDPAAGIRHDATTFGRTNAEGCHFLLMDGSVRFLSQDVDPAVLKAIATPKGGENVGAF
jgi:hypothetical protein